MNIVIGIISYFTDIREIRNHRVRQLQYLIEQCDKLFNLPIDIVAQNWGDDCKCIQSKNLRIFHHEKLGIVGARKKLREYFLNSEYDYMIMLDDDCILLGSELDVKMYLHDIQNTPAGCVFPKVHVGLKLTAVSKEIMREVDFFDLMPENNEAHEDWLWQCVVTTNFPEKCVFSKTRLSDLSNSINDPYSTWRNEYKDVVDRELLVSNTTKILNLIQARKLCVKNGIPSE